MPVVLIGEAMLGAAIVTRDFAVAGMRRAP
jgi:hypothetical protein